MKNIIFTTLAILIFNSYSVYSQNQRALTTDGKLKESISVVSDILTTIQAGENVRIISGPTSGIYYVEYQGIKGYLNEIYFAKTTTQPKSIFPAGGSDIFNHNQKSNNEGHDFLEGLYLRTAKTEHYFNESLYKSYSSIDYDTIYVIKKGDYYEIGHLKKGILGKLIVASTGLILFETTVFQYMGLTNIDRKISAIIKILDKNILQLDNMRVNLDDNEYAIFNDIFTKIFDPGEANASSANYRTGSGFALTSNGYIVTCNHVVENAAEIKIRGVGGDFSKTWEARLVSTDPKNDIAILKITDASFSSLGAIPYTLSANSIEVGSNIFTMGYPLTATMGEEIKLTNGIISAKSGFKGDITSYQISAAAQPGNSGGPLFDQNGSIIGIINAKHVEAENVTYAIKTVYLNGMITTLPSKITLPQLNLLSGKTLTDQVKIVRNFIYIIEVK